MRGSEFFYSYEIWFVASHKNNIKGWESTGRKAKTINIRFSNIKHYNSFVKAYNEVVYGKNKDYEKHNNINNCITRFKLY